MADALLRSSLRLVSPSPKIPLSVPFSTVPLRWKRLGRSPGSESVAVVFRRNPMKRWTGLLTRAIVPEDDGLRWWQKNVENMIDVHSIEEFLNILGNAGDKLVIADFYGTWCGSCRALFPKLCKIAEEHPDIIFVKVNFDENKPMCKRLNVRVLPYFHFYRGADGLLESFSCSLVKLHKIKDAIALHNTARCSIGPPTGVGNIDLFGGASPKDKPAKAIR